MLRRAAQAGHFVERQGDFGGKKGLCHSAGLPPNGVGFQIGRGKFPDLRLEGVGLPIPLPVKVICLGPKNGVITHSADGTIARPAAGTRPCPSPDRHARPARQHAGQPSLWIDVRLELRLAAAAEAA